MRTSGWIRRWGVVAAMATLSLIAAGAAAAQARGGFRGGGFSAGGVAHFGGAAPRFGGGYYGRGYYGRGYYGRGCCGWGWGPGWWWGTGLYLSVLPWYYETLWWDGIPYYYTGDGYYVWDGAAREYQQINPPAGLGQGGGATGPAAMNAEVFAYPKAGQSEEQQARDRDECRRWASDQSASEGAPVPPGGAAGGAAPSAAAPPTGSAAPAKGSVGAGSAARDAMAQHQGYLRAETACLEGRNYSVR